MTHRPAPPQRRASAATVLLAFCSLFSCGTAFIPAATVRANRDPTWTSRFTRLLVIVPRSAFPDEDSMFRRFLEQSFASQRTSVLVVVATNGTTLPETMRSAELNEQRPALEALQPEATLELRPSFVVLAATDPEWRAHVEYDASLYTNSGQAETTRIWRAAVRHSGPAVGMEGRFQLAALRLVERLARDGLLTGGATSER